MTGIFTYLAPHSWALHSAIVHIEMYYYHTRIYKRHAWIHTNTSGYAIWKSKAYQYLVMKRIPIYLNSRHFLPTWHPIVGLYILLSCSTLAWYDIKTVLFSEPYLYLWVLLSALSGVSDTPHTVSTDKITYKPRTTPNTRWTCLKKIGSMTYGLSRAW